MKEFNVPYFGLHFECNSHVCTSPQIVIMQETILHLTILLYPYFTPLLFLIKSDMKPTWHNFSQVLYTLMIDFSIFLMVYMVNQ